MALKFGNGYMLVLFVKDYARMRDFYRDVIGLEYVHGTDAVDAFFQLGPDGLMMISQDTADNLLSPVNVDHDPARGARSVFVTEVGDVDAAYQELRDRGAEFIREPEDRHWGLRTAHLRDPEGNVWEIHARIEE